MADPHRTNLLVTSCLKTPVDPHRKTPVPLYERQRLMLSADENMDKRDYEKEEVRLYALLFVSLRYKHLFFTSPI